MAANELILEGLNLLVIGMGTVFMFLAFLVGSVMLMSKFAKWIESMHPQLAHAGAGATGGVADEHIAVIAAAVRRFRADHSI